MGSLYTWVRHDWCPSCFRTTEQERWHTGRVPGEPRSGVQARCKECDRIVPPPSVDDIPGFPARAVDDGDESPGPASPDAWYAPRHSAG